LAAWHEELLTLNPWARALIIDEDNAEFAAARQKATLARHAKGHEAWNGWANGMLALKAALEAAGEWAVKPGYSRPRGPGSDFVPPEGKNEATRVWLALASAVFSTEVLKHRFETVVTFRRFVFPGNACFERSTFSAAVFKHATFGGVVWFNGATFGGEALFNDTTFGGAAWFHGATFGGYVEFYGATFGGTAWFNGTTFGGEAGFKGATFGGEAGFEDANFNGTAWFKGATFNAKADLKRVEFKKWVTFADSTFRKAADFDGIESAAAFLLPSATFKQVPSFIGATFKSALRLDNVETPRYRWTLGYTPDKDATARFRELKRRAVEAQDRERELEFFAQEVRTGRFHAKGLPSWVPKAWSWRFWSGLAYGALSDFGRSLWRPLLSWLALTVLCAAFFLGENDDVRRTRAALAPTGFFGTVTAYVATTRDALANPPACLPRPGAQAIRLHERRHRGLPAIAQERSGAQHRKHRVRTSHPRFPLWPGAGWRPTVRERSCRRLGGLHGASASERPPHLPVPARSAQSAAVALIAPGAASAIAYDRLAVEHGVVAGLPIDDGRAAFNGFLFALCAENQRGAFGHAGEPTPGPAGVKSSFALEICARNCARKQCTDLTDLESA